MQTIWQRVDDLNDVDWPEEAIAVVDETLVSWAPESLRGRTIAVRAGESLKTLASIETLAEQVLALRATRPLTIVAMGGGSVGDAVGFLASVLWRGVTLWHVPTTLLAAADSAHGGKTAVNLGNAKNQIGTFWAAERVILAENILAELPVERRAEGLTEVVKGLWLGAPAALDTVDRLGTGELAFGAWEFVRRDIGELLDAAIAVKQAIVLRDPREQLGIRTWLNLGHTVAHSLELLCGASHGAAVAWGLAAAAHLSERVGMSEADCRRLTRHAAPLMGNLPLEVDRDAFHRALLRDKKTVDGKLRSVLLRGAGDPVVVDDVTADDWFEALRTTRELVFEGPVAIELTRPRPAELRITASKSEMNRALVIAALRKAETSVVGESVADDVRAMRAGIESLQRGETADAGNGGTTFRFLAAVAVCAAHGGRIRIGEQLAGRPHDSLLSALRAAGVEIRVRERLYEFGPLPPGPVSVDLDASRSSQFASAMALISASGRDVRLRIGEGMRSGGYFQMTVDMLARAGVEHRTVGDVHEFRPERPPAPATLVTSADASSAAVWAVYRRLGGEVRLQDEPGTLQPDHVVGDLLWERDDVGPIRLDVGETPDLVPVLTAYAALSAPEVTLFGAPHLRDKESNRIDDLAAAFADVGITVQTREDGIVVPAGIQRPTSGALFDPRDDHRLAFAALLLATAEPLRLCGARCVTKSYPEIYADARRLGFEVELCD